MVNCKTMKRLLLLVLTLCGLWLAPAKAQTINVTTDRSSSSLGTDNVRPFNDIALYPNPAHGELNIAVDPNMGIKTISVYNLIGKLVISAKVTGSAIKMDIEDIPTGIYFLRAIDAQGRVVTSRKFTHQ